MTLPAPYTTTDWYFEDAHAEKDGGNFYYAAIARKTGDSSIAIVFYV